MSHKYTWHIFLSWPLKIREIPFSSLVPGYCTVSDGLDRGLDGGGDHAQEPGQHGDAGGTTWLKHVEFADTWHVSDDFAYQMPC